MGWLMKATNGWLKSTKIETLQISRMHLDQTSHIRVVLTHTEIERVISLLEASMTEPVALIAEAPHLKNRK